MSDVTGEFLMINQLDLNLKIYKKKIFKPKTMNLKWHHRQSTPKLNYLLEENVLILNWLPEIIGQLELESYSYK